MFETVFESQSAGFVLGPEMMIGRNNSIEIRVKITAVKFTLHPRMKSKVRAIGARDSGEMELFKKSREASNTAINEAVNIMLDAR